MKTLLTTLFFTFSLILFGQPINEVAAIYPSDGDYHDGFGGHVALAGDFAFITAEGDRSKGSVYVYKFENNNWVEYQKFSPDSNDSGVSFGSDVAMTEDYAVVGFSHDSEYDTYSGSAMIYRNNNGTWEFDQKIKPDTGYYNDRFGASVDIFGDYIIVGTPSESGNGNYGAAYIFHKEASGWKLQQRIIANSSNYGDAFAKSVAITPDYAFVGAPNVDYAGTNSGIVYVFERNGTTWSQTHTISPADADVGFYFGYSLDISESTLAIGAHEAGVSYDTKYGRVYLFEKQGSNWVETHTLLASDGEHGDDFGSGVSISCDHLLISARYNEEQGLNNGAAYFFKKEGNNWVEIFKAMGSQGGGLITSTAITCDKAMIGASANGINGGGSGIAYGYIDTTNTGVGFLPVTSENTVSFYPNPADNSITIFTNNQTMGTISLYSITGKKVLVESIQNANQQIDISNLPSGLYLIEINTSKGVVSNRLIIE